MEETIISSDSHVIEVPGQRQRQPKTHPQRLVDVQELPISGRTAEVQMEAGTRIVNLLRIVLDRMLDRVPEQTPVRLQLRRRPPLCGPLRGEAFETLPHFVELPDFLGCEAADVRAAGR